VVVPAGLVSTLPMGGGGLGNNFEIEGRPVRLRNPREAVDHGITYLSEDRKGKGLHVRFSLLENLTLMDLDRHARPWLDPRSEREALRQAVRAYDGRLAPTTLLRHLLDEFAGDPYAIVRWADTAPPAEFGRLAPLVVEYARQLDPAAVELMQRAAHHIDTLAARLVARGVERIALAGGLAPHLEGWLAPQTRQYLVAPQGDALAGALGLAQSARAEADAGVEA